MDPRYFYRFLNLPNFYLDLITPAQYWHDPFNRTGFLAGSHYLADINNEREGKNDDYRKGKLIDQSKLIVLSTETVS